MCGLGVGVSGEGEAPTTKTTDPEGLRRVHLGGREVILVGTAHVSQASVELVRRVIAEEAPDCVCVELDRQRHEALARRDRFESLDLRALIRNRQLSTLLVQLVLAAYQKRLGLHLGVEPGSELLAAVAAAEEQGIPVRLCDRDVRVTLRRAGRALPFFKKVMLLSQALASLVERPQLTAEEIEELKQQDLMNNLLRELGTALPSLKRALIDERDGYLAARIREAPGEKVVAVVGAAHLPGILEALVVERQVDLAELERIPPASPVWKVIAWGIPAVIVAAIAWIGWTRGAAAAGDNVAFWVLANGIPAAVGAAIGLAHPLTVLAAFLAAPVTSLTPVIGAGYVTAFVQAYIRPPIVRELRSVADDAAHLPRWWRNRLLKVFLAFVLPTIGSLIGTWVGGARILGELF